MLHTVDEMQRHMLSKRGHSRQRSRAVSRRTPLALVEQRLEALVVEEAGEESPAVVIGPDQRVLGLPVGGCKLCCALRAVQEVGFRCMQLGNLR